MKNKVYVGGQRLPILHTHTHTHMIVNLMASLGPWMDEKFIKNSEILGKLSQMLLCEAKGCTVYTHTSMYVHICVYLCMWHHSNII